ncbi:hypothetical protein LZF95_13275 [Algoriphagus sp. AGSA1]|uniref:hypothetical protein n=1 Tax=Algoriphagus sp. AGSA1 TaxID=2907213 RepID=UPI001F393203|nr:hypothetical protein [Algoriphagus sp. AGSA1]MCE7055652.1 hypothetical protein [Algoriphagus sp. AGSA1]
MKRHLYSSLPVLSTLILVTLSCGTKKDSEGSTLDYSKTAYELIKVDSFQINNFTRVNILDYSPEEKIYLGYSLTEDDILEISEEGEILRREHKKGEGPGLYGNRNPTGLCFGPNGQRFVELPFQIISYDQDYEIIHQQRLLSPLPIRTSTPLGRPPYFQHNDTTKLLVGPSNYISANYLIHTKEGKDTLQNFYELNLLSGAVKSVVSYEPTSIYNSTEKIYSGLMGKSFFIDHHNNELVLVHNLEKEILIYELPDFSLKRSIPISHSQFKTYSPIPLGSNPSDNNQDELGRLSAHNQKLFDMSDGFYLLQYFTGISQAEYDSRHTEEKPYVGKFDPQEQRIILFKNGKQLSPELDALDGSLIISLPDNKILVQERENTEIEEEFTRFYIYQLQTK